MQPVFDIALNSGAQAPVDQSIVTGQRLAVAVHAPLLRQRAVESLEHTPTSAADALLPRNYQTMRVDEERDHCRWYEHKKLEK